MFNQREISDEQPNAAPDGPVPVTRRVLLGIAATLAGIPILSWLRPFRAMTGHQTTSDVPPLPAEDHPEARAQTVNNLKFIAWALHSSLNKNGGRLPAAAIS